MITTGHGALRTTWSDTDPSRARFTPPRPRVPSTIARALRSAARSHRARAASPRSTRVWASAEPERVGGRLQQLVGAGERRLVELLELALGHHAAGHAGARDQRRVAVVHDRHEQDVVAGDSSARPVRSASIESSDPSVPAISMAEP